MSALTVTAQVGLAWALFAFIAPAANAVSIELKGASSDRIERQRRAATGRLPLAGTPNIARRTVRLNDKDLKSGDPVFIRIFKEESELEIWMRNGNTFVHFATYPICNWSGGLGPKLMEGDRQAPEGFYTVTRRRLHRTGRWPQSLNLGFPNVFDRSMARTGSYILVHGGCTSVGCFAMTNPVIDEIYSLTAAAIKAGQSQIHVHVMPFRMTDKKLARHAQSQWLSFWQNLKLGYDAFERTRVPPRIDVCNNKYKIREDNGTVAQRDRPLVPCSTTAALAKAHARFANILHSPAQWKNHIAEDRELIETLHGRATTALKQLARRAPFKSKKITRRVAPSRPRVTCKLTLASCRRHMALKQARARRATGKTASRKIARERTRKLRTRRALARR